MPRPKNSVPTYRRHSSSGQACVWLNGRDVYLGKYNSPESRAEYARLVAELAAAPAAPPTLSRRSGPTVDEVLLAFWRWAESHYRRPDGTPTNQIVEYRSTLRPLRALYGHTPAADFGPLALKTVRAEMVRLDWCRTQVNSRVGKIKRVFKWAASEQLVPVTTYTALATVAGLQKGRAAVRESEPVGPVDPAHVAATLPYLSAHVRGLVEFQRLTGCRPGEACLLRRCDIDATGDVWLYRPETHKTAHQGKGRVIAIGPKAQSVLKDFLDADPAAYLFEPRAESSRGGERYTAHSYNNALRRAAKRAGVPHWHANQLRHLHATEVRRKFGVESAGAALGHTKMSATEIYAERDVGLAIGVAREVG